jgi:hypothetical protein
MKAIHLAVIALLIIQGCATGRNSEPGFYNWWHQNRKLESAREKLAAEDRNAAASIFTEIVNAPPEKGVTDEALFQLALLQLKPNQERDGIPQAQRLLERLQHEFSDSPWSTQAAQLLELFGKFRSTKEHSSTLLRENRELRQSIQKLKDIDLELEQKKRK